MLVHVHIEILKILTKKQKELLEAYLKEFGESSSGDDNFFDKMKNI